jgi:hypothetical protein
VYSLDLSSLNFKHQDAFAQVFNSTGALVLNQKLNITNINSLFQVNLTEEANGLYFFSLKNGNETFYQKLIKQ